MGWIDLEVFELEVFGCFVLKCLEFCRKLILTISKAISTWMAIQTISYRVSVWALSIFYHMTVVSGSLVWFLDRDIILLLTKHRYYIFRRWVYCLFGTFLVSVRTQSSLALTVPYLARSLRANLSNRLSRHYKRRTFYRRFNWLFFYWLFPTLRRLAINTWECLIKSWWCFWSTQLRHRHLLAHPGCFTARLLAIHSRQV